jgi:hypothetical protein
MRRVKDVFDPTGLSNPGKIFPPAGDGEGDGAHAGTRSGFCGEARWW